MNKIGAFTAAAMVCPTSTCRPITTPSIGDRMTVRSRFTRASVTAGLGGGDPRVGGFHVCGGLQHRRARQIELGAGELRIAGERLGTVEFPAGIVQRRLEAGPFGPRLDDARLGFDEPSLKGRGIESSEHLAGFDA